MQYPDPQASLTPHEALSRLSHANRGRQSATLPLEIVNALTQSLYPPGTLVELTDGSVGIVASVNLHAPIQRRILLYNPDLHRHEAVTIDLSQAPTSPSPAPSGPKTSHPRRWSS